MPAVVGFGGCPSLRAELWRRGCRIRRWVGKRVGIACVRIWGTRAAAVAGGRVGAAVVGRIVAAVVVVVDSGAELVGVGKGGERAGEDREKRRARR